MSRSVAIATACAVIALALSGCSAAGVTSSSSTGSGTSSRSEQPTRNIVVVPQDATAFKQLEKAAPRSLNLDGGTVTSTTCWTPSEHLFNDTSVAPAGTWKVLCRVHYTKSGVPRYQDATCIGDFDKTPMLSRCYVWEYYTYVPGYSDGNRLASPPPTPLP